MRAGLVNSRRHTLRELCPCLAALLLVAGCATPRAPIACPTADASTRTAKIFYATDRGRTPASEGVRFGGARTNPPGLHMGWELVRIGPEHRLGKVDAAIGITAHEETASPGGSEVNALQRSDAEIVQFVERRLRPAIRAAPPPRAGQRRQVLVFIHGYRVTFAEAVRNTAQLAADLELINCNGDARGVAITYSWPAQGALLSYLADEENAEWTQQRLAPFLLALAQVCRQEGAELHLIAHSMGARALVRSLADVADACQRQGLSGNLADHVILLAPDIGKGLFDQYVERFLPLVGHLTIYVSRKDRALGLSSILHGGHRRLGLIESTLLAALQLTGIGREDHRELADATAAEIATGKVDMIDVTGSFASQFGHSYEDPAFIHDLRALIYHDTPAGVGERSNLVAREVQQGVFRTVKTLSYFQLQKPPH